MLKAIFHLNKAEKIRITLYNKSWANIAIKYNWDTVKK